MKSLLLSSALVLVFTFAGCASSSTDPDRIAQRLLNENIPQKERAETAREHVEKAADLLVALADGMEPGTEEEYRRIPWLWRVSRAAGESNDPEVIREVLSVSMPKQGGPLHDWQAVVVGGGIVNGLYVANEWPRERVDEILTGYEDLADRFQRTVDLSADMADDETVPDPTRFDALLLIGTSSWDEASQQLIHYLRDPSEEELQTGAVLGLAGMDAPKVDSVLINHLENLTPRNRRIAYDALLRTDERALALLDAVDRGVVSADSLGSERAEQLRSHSSEDVRSRARSVLPDS